MIRSGARKVRDLLLSHAGRGDHPLAAAIRRRSKVTFSKLGRMGRFGNQLFQIAAVLGYADKYGCRAILPEWRCPASERNYGDIFLGYSASTDAVPSGPIYRERRFGFDPIPFIYNVDLSGWFQSERYFSPIANYIRELFSEPPSMKRELDRYCAEHQLNDFDALHLRCYSGHTFDAGAEMLPVSYFRAALRHVEDQTPLVVATDDKKTALATMPGIVAGRPVHFLHLSDDLLDFFMLSRARRLVISNSSYSWWAAYLGREKALVLAPKRHLWISTNNRSRHFFVSHDVYRPCFREVPN